MSREWKRNRREWKEIRTQTGRRREEDVEGMKVDESWEETDDKTTSAHFTDDQVNFSNQKMQIRIPKSNQTHP